MPRIAPLFLLAGLGLSTAACSTNPATGGNSLAFMTPAEEQRIGTEEHPKIVAEYGGTYDHQGLAAYVTSVGNKLAAVSERKDQKFTFTVLDSDVVNAFALPGGYVYVTRGLVALTSSESELAGVVGHEIGHVVARHTAQRDARGKIAGTFAGLTGLIFGKGVASEVASYGAGAYVQGYSRDQEFEADMLGVRYIARAGYDPAAMGGFLSKLQAISQFEAQKAGQSGEEGFDIMASHPRTLDRVADAIKEAKEKTVADPIVNRDILLGHLDGMVYGQDPAKGMVRGQQFYYPPLKLKFAAPARFRLQNGQSEVIGTGPNSLAFVFDVGKAAAGQNADQYLRSWGAKLGVSSTQPMSAMGKSGASASGILRSEDGSQKAVKLVAIRGDGDLVYRFQFMGPASGASAVESLSSQVLGSLAPLSDSEATAVQPARIAIVTAATQAEANSLVSKMKYEGTTDKRLFEILNGLAPGEMPKPGVKMKIIQ